MKARYFRVVALLYFLGWALAGNCQPAVAPPLTISSAAKSILLKWPTNSSGFVLETAGSLNATVVWTPQTNGISVSGTSLVFTVPGSASSAFYRLHSVNQSEAIVAQPLTWTWVPITNCYCMEGSTTGLGVNLNTNTTQVLIYLLGGGACWDYTTCYVLNTAVHGPFGEREFTNAVALFDQSWFLDRTSTNNPFRDYSYVLIPYCTGDLFAGSQVNVYSTNVTMQVGFLNMENYLRRLVPTFPGVQRIVLAGSSAGGYGAAFNWLQTQLAFGNVRVDLIDDSGPILTPDVLSQGSQWFVPGSVPTSNWDFTAALPPACETCATNFSSLYSFIAASAASHRAALLSYDQDSTIRSYLGLSAAQFSNGLTELAAAEFAPHADLGYFFVSGTSHVLMLTPSASVGGVTLQQFITQMVTDDPAWTSHHP